MIRSTIQSCWPIAAATLGMLLVGCESTTPTTSPVPGPSVTPSKTPAPSAAPRPLPSRKEVQGPAIRVPYILWGGDMATFYGNGGTRTTEGSVFHQQGLVVDLVDGNNFDKQLADFESGASPFLRGTFRMIGLAAEKLQDPAKKPIVFMQMTWSAGDHLVARDSVKTLADLKGKTIAIQKGGPHVGMLDDVLNTSHLGWNDVKITWVDNITGAGSPAEVFRANENIDAAFVITPDMLGLTAGLDQIGTGAEGTVKGARVAVSTAELSRSIADVYAVRADYWQSNPDKVTALTTAYLKSVEKLIDLKKQFESQGSDEYILELLQLSQNIFGAEAIPTLEEDAHGLLSDCTFVGWPGNVSFFTDKRNLHGFEDFNKRTMTLAVNQGYAKKRVPLTPSPLDWNDPKIKGQLSKTGLDRGARFQAEALQTEIEGLDADGVIDSRTLISFTIGFQPNQTEFDARKYSAEYKRAFELADRFGNAAVIIRGHSDTTLVLRDAVKAGLESGKLKRSGTKANYQYFLEGRPIDLNDPKAMADAIQSSDAFRARAEFDPRKTMQAALNLSRERADAVRTSLLEYARQNSVAVDESQIQSQGVGIREPLVARPRSAEEAALNMRVEFRLVRVSAEAMTASDFDF